MTLNEIMDQLKVLGTEQTKNTFTRHGAKEPFYGVKVGDLKKLVKHLKKDHDLAMALYNTGNHDAMYLAGLSVDPRRMTKQQLQQWVKQAYWYMLAEYTVAQVTAESPFALELAREWIEADEEMIATAGWSTYANYVSTTPDEELDLNEIRQLLDRAELTVHKEQNRVRYAINNFVICIGAYVAPLTELAMKTAAAIGKVHVDVGQTACKVPKVPLATAYIEKVIDKGRTGVKRKTCIC